MDRPGSGILGVCGGYRWGHLFKWDCWRYRDATNARLGGVMVHTLVLLRVHHSIEELLSSKGDRWTAVRYMRLAERAMSTGLGRQERERERSKERSEEFARKTLKHITACTKREWQ